MQESFNISGYTFNIRDVEYVNKIGDYTSKYKPKIVLKSGKEIIVLNMHGSYTELLTAFDNFNK